MIAIYDTLAQDFAGPIQLMRHTAPAIRMFGDVMQGENFARHAEDFHLVSVGTLDPTTGAITSTERTVILTGATLRAMLMQQQAQQETKV